MNRSLHAFLLVFALLFAQAGAVAHAAGHVVAASHGSDKGLPADAACELCVGYAQLSGTAPAQPLILPLCLAAYQRPDFALALNAAFAPVEARARAPPARPV